MTNEKPVYLSICISICSLIAHGSAVVHSWMIRARLTKEPSYLHNPVGVYRNLHNIWNSRIVRRVVSVLVRSPLRSSTLRLVNFTIPLPTSSGCIVVTCHTPWKRLLVQWCLEHDFALIIAAGKWTHKRGKIQKEGKGFNELRHIVKFLQQNGRIIMAADTFNDLKNCPVNFLGRCYNASLLPARLARIANVPLIVAFPVLANGTINFNDGAQFNLEASQLDSRSVIQNLLSLLDNEIKKDPSIWIDYVR